jgi:hypothetical protein
LIALPIKRVMGLKPKVLPHKNLFYSISKKRPEETFRAKVESCRNNVELTPPGIEWLPESLTLRIHWLLPPDRKGMPEVRTIRLGPDGRPDTPQAKGPGDR